MNTRIELLKTELPKVFKARGRRRQVMLDEINQLVESILSTYNRVTDSLETRVEYLEETNRRLCAEINWTKCLARDKNEIEKSRLEWDRLQSTDPEKCSEGYCRSGLDCKVES